MATSKDKVKEAYPMARQERYTTHGGVSHYLIWESHMITARRLGQGKTASAAWVDAAMNMEK